MVRNGFLDTNILIHALRGRSIALTWLATQTTLSITPLVWMEVMYGAQRKSVQIATQQLLSQFEMVYLTSDDMDWAMDRLQTYRLSHGVAVVDCLIASVCARLQVPLYTLNVADMLPILGAALVVKPYSL